MPWLDSNSPSSPGAQVWQTVIKHALARRLRAEQLLDPFRELRKRHRVAARDIADVLVGFRASAGVADDPLIFSYAELLLQWHFIGSGDLLLALLHRSRYGPGLPDGFGAGQSSALPSCEERIFNLLSQMLMGSELPPSVWKSHELIHAITRWLQITTEYEMGKQIVGAGLHTLDPTTYGMYEALGTLAIAVFGNQALRNLSDQSWWKQRRAVVVTKMVDFDTHILQWMSSQIAGRLRTLAGMPPYLATDKYGRPVFTEQQVLDMIADIPVVNSRAGLFVWLDASLCARPLTDDMSMLAYLHGRYDADSQSMVVDFITASFDVLTNALLRKDPPQTVKIVRSFICNKVPILLTMMSGMIAPLMTVETFVQLAFMSGSMIQMEPLAPLTPGATDIRDSLKATRLEFLQACVLHGVVTDTCVSSIVQDATIPPSRVLKYTKEGLITQCTNNIGRLESLIGELEGMQGNASAIAGCMAEMISSLCIAKDTMSVKSICIEMIKRIPLMDIILQYTQAGMILVPLCTLLNDWVHDQDQTEFAPAYEEFATILLFTLATIYRYDLKPSEIGLVADNFVARLLDEMTVSKLPRDLPEEQATQLAKWIEGLYSVDDHGETSGIGDDVMRQCSPQSFYMLVPTLFEQSVFACNANALPMKTFKGGLELLLEPFLLPSLIMGLGWLAQHSWEDHNDVDILLGILDKLLKPSTSSQETQAMHKAILAMVALPLSKFLHHLQGKKQDKKKKMNELLGLLRPYLNQQRTLQCAKSEMDAWMQPAESLVIRVRHSIRNLVDWAANPSHPPNPPPKFTYREFVFACQVLKGRGMLQVLLAELKHNTFNASIALDITTALLCTVALDSLGAQAAPRSVEAVTRVRDNIRLQASDIQTLLQQPQSDAEALIRLSKRIEAQLAIPQIPPIAMPIPLPEQATDQMIQDLGLSGLAGDVAGVGGEASAALTVLDPPLDLSNPSAQDLADITVASDAMQMDQSQIFDDLGLSMGQAPDDSQPMEGLGTQEEDIFAGLDMDMGMGDLADW